MKIRLTFDFLAFFLGLALFAAGLYLVYPPAALIGPGVILMAVSVFGPRFDRGGGSRV